jgi:hypothetical protein
MDNNNVKTEIDKDDLIRILDYLSKSKNHRATADSIKNDLFPDMEVDDFKSQFKNSLFVGIEPITVFLRGNVIDRFICRDGLAEYVTNLRKEVKRQRLHKIVEFLCTNATDVKKSFDSEEIAKAFNPELSLYEANKLCEVLIANGDVNNATTDQSDLKDILILVVTSRTRTAYHNKKYLEEDEQIGIPVGQTVFSGDNISIVRGSNFETIKQEDHSTKIGTKDKGLPTWANWLIVIFTILGSIAAIIAAVYLFK